MPLGKVEQSVPARAAKSLNRLRAEMMLGFKQFKLLETGCWRVGLMRSTLQPPVVMVITQVGIQNVAIELAGPMMLMKGWLAHPGFIKAGIKTALEIVAADLTPG